MSKDDLVQATAVPTDPQCDQLHAVPTLIELMTQAVWEHRAESVAWVSIPEFLRRDQCEEMRAALLALAEATIPPEVLVAGAEASFGPFNRHDNSCLNLSQDAFRAMLHEIASSPQRSGDRPVAPNDEEAA